MKNARTILIIARAPLVACALVVLVALTTVAQKPEAPRRDTGNDLFWKKLETRVDEIADRLDGVMGVAR